jgi:hypothetical protein
VLEFIALGAALEFIVLEFFASVLDFIALVFYRAGVYRTGVLRPRGRVREGLAECKAGSTGDRREKGRSREREKF